MNAPLRTPSTFTSAEFHKLVSAGGFGDVRVELRRGMIARMSPQYAPHAAVKMELTFALAQALKNVGLAWKVWSEVSVAFGDGFEPLPDIVVWDPAAAPPELDGPIPAAAVRLLIEVADATLGDDLGEKLEDYARAGLPEYWVADVKGRLVLRHAGPSANGYATREAILFGQPLSSLLHPALRIDTSSLKR